ncbi:MAG: PAS domain S-box protein, partial [Nitrospinae bacterium]|nr:PAS domain S-box protein [Nitrospinota bacterium]
MKILIVDDEEHICALVSKMLEWVDENIETEEATNPDSALNILKEKSFDCILIDHLLQNSTGLQLFHKIREQNIQTPVVMMSAQAGRDEVANAIRKGVADYLDKNYWTRETLLFSLQKAIRSHKSETKAKDTERNYLQLQQRYKQILNALDEGILGLDLEGKIVFANPGAERMLGFNAPELARQELHPLIPHTREDGTPCSSEECSFHNDLQNINAMRSCEERFLRKDGTSFPVEYSCRSLMDQKKLAGCVITFQDISLRKSTTTALESSRETFRAIFDNIIDGIVMIDEKGNIHSVNPAAERLFGYSLTELLEKNIRMLMPEPFFSEHDQYMNNYRETGKRKIIGIGREVIGLRKNGSEFPMDLAINEMYIDGQRMFSGIIRDITERKKAEMELRRSKEEAETANRAKSDFLAHMSHELRTPMNAILGFGQLIEMDPSEPVGPNQKMRLKEILKAGNHLLDLINSVLDLSRIEAGKMDLSIGNILVNDLAEEALTLIEPLARSHGIRLNKSFKNQDPFWVRADQTRLKQVLLNLLSNAIKYNRENGEVDLDFSKTSNDRVLIRVSDTGAGIPENLHETVFEPFNRLQADQTAVEGTGIGLTISRKLVQLMNGSIDFKSSPETGTCFMIELPQGHPTGAGLPPDQPRTDEATIPEKKPSAFSLLYIEDTPANLELVKQILKQRPTISLLTAQQDQPQAAS